MAMESAQIQAPADMRERLLEAAGYNVTNLHPADVEYDFMTDSWTELVSDEMTSRIQSLQAAINHDDRDMHVAAFFPFRHFSYVSQGRAAEAFFWRAAARKDRIVVQNLLFPTTRHHLVLNRMQPVELPVAHVYSRTSPDLFRGNLDCGRLRDMLRGEDAARIGFIYIEAENNASGGYPVSMANVREIRSIVADHNIHMVLDATRLVENAVLIKRHEAGYENKSIIEIVQEFCGYFDSMTCSMAKDFGVIRGGLIASNDEKLHYRAKDHVSFYGPGINAYDKAMINAVFRDPGFIEAAVTRRVDQALRLHAAMTAAGLSVCTPAAGHCLVIDAADYLDISRYKNPVTALVSWLYRQTGVRSGMQVTGMTRDYARPTYIRFAIPLCTPDAKVDAMTAPFVQALQNVGDIPDMEKTSSLPGITGQLNARFCEKQPATV